MPCPICGNRLYVIGSKKRKVIEADESKTVLIIRRLRCVLCEKIHHELPDIIVPYKRHRYETIEKAINGATDDVTYNESTINRFKAWWKALLPYFINILASLSMKYGIAPVGGQYAPREIIRIVTNANFWVHTRSAFLSG